MQKPTFFTETDENHVKKQRIRVMLILFIIGTALSCLGFLIAWQTFVFLEILCVSSIIYACIMRNRNKQAYLLHFEGDRLYIKDKFTSNIYEVYDIPASDFIINQTKKEIDLDYCSVCIKGTVFAFGGVKNCKELKKYIADNYQ